MLIQSSEHNNFTALEDIQDIHYPDKSINFFETYALINFIWIVLYFILKFVLVFLTEIFNIYN